MPQVINLNQQLTFGAPNSPFGAENAFNAFTTTQTLVIPLGVWMIKIVDTNQRVEYSPDSGSTWRSLIVGAADRGLGAIYSDGFNVRFAQSAATQTVTTYYSKVKALY